MNDRLSKLFHASLDVRVLDIASKFHAEGFRAILCGGAIRDMLCGASPNDYDIISDATVEQLMRIFPTANRSKNGLPHVILVIDDMIFDLLSLKDLSNVPQAEYSFQMISDRLYADSLSRDFTCNAVYYDLGDFSIYDFHHGIDHINSRILHQIEPIKDLFKQHPVRILRAIRFNCSFDFRFSPELNYTISRLNKIDSNIEAPKMRAELIRHMASVNASLCLQGLDKYKLLCQLVNYAPLNSDAVHCWYAHWLNKSRFTKSHEFSDTGFYLAILFWPEVASNFVKMNLGITQEDRDEAIFFFESGNDPLNIRSVAKSVLNYIWRNNLKIFRSDLFICSM